MVSRSAVGNACRTARSHVAAVLAMTARTAAARSGKEWLDKKSIAGLVIQESILKGVTPAVIVASGVEKSSRSGLPENAANHFPRHIGKPEIAPLVVV